MRLGSTEPGEEEAEHTLQEEYAGLSFRDTEQP